MRMPTELERAALALPTTAIIGECDINVRKVPAGMFMGHPVMGYKSLCRTHWAESPVCNNKRAALADAEKHAKREADIAYFKEHGKMPGT